MRIAVAPHTHPMLWAGAANTSLDRPWAEWGDRRSRFRGCSGRACSTRWGSLPVPSRARFVDQQRVRAKPVRESLENVPMTLRPPFDPSHRHSHFRLSKDCQPFRTPWPLRYWPDDHYGSDLNCALAVPLWPGGTARVGGAFRPTGARLLGPRAAAHGCGAV